MKKYALVLTTIVLSVALVATESPAQRRGGSGGGGGRGGGGGGARPSANRSPSMSRPSPQPSTPSLPSAGQKPSTRPSTPSVGQKPSTRPSTPAVGQKPTTRPGSGQKPSTPGAGQQPSTRPGGPVAGTRPSIDRGKIQNNIKPGQQPSMPDWFKPGATPPTAGTLPAKPGAAVKPGGGLPGLKPPGEKPPVATPPIAGGDRPGTKPPVTKPPVTRPPVTRPPGERPPVASRPPGYQPPTYHPPYHPWYPNHPNYHDHHHWWQWATAAAVTGWVVNAWANPIYYRYGRGGNVYYDNNVVYVDGQQYGTAQQYYDEASQIAASAPEPTEQQAQTDNWLPLGVFALTKEGVNATNMYLQLALRKDGLIGGTFYNESTGVSHPLEGMVDEKTQRAVWKAADGTNENLIMETGIYNLSENEANVLVHFGPDETQEALLVRLEEAAEAPQPQEE